MLKKAFGRILNAEGKGMLTGKQRSFLKRIAHSLEPVVYMGKAGLTENVVKEMEDYLNAHEILKVKLQEGCLYDAKEAANASANVLGAEFVQAIGRKFTLYRPSEQNLIEIPKR